MNAGFMYDLSTLLSGISCSNEYGLKGYGGRIRFRDEYMCIYIIFVLVLYYYESLCWHITLLLLLLHVWTLNIVSHARIE